ncbi:hypothetical protein F441_13924 [Phytophthora nicotianae CJ01A1]|uniref:Uncharacterized protein n=1 Tax=Phytophthora nicotianae CJ01A1 TaxID=1317063 RepID=W2WIP7_PHYNI|nr:hypothetical protein F441_13924 [Phytophthora nicotianae CJ01A1]
MPALSRSSIVVENVTAPILLWCRLGGKAVDFLQTLGADIASPGSYLSPK